MINFAQDYTFENETALLRPLRQADYKTLLPFTKTEPEMWKYSLVPPNTEENMKNYIAQALEKRTKKDSYPFIVFDKRNGECAGSTRFYDYQPAHKTVQLGYTWYGKDFRGTGLNKNCKYLMLSFAFEEAGIERVEFRAHSENTRSIAAMKSIGCTVEGILRSNFITYNGRRDSIVLSILKEEWFGSLKEQLEMRL